jgi:hypothetical protein
VPSRGVAQHWMFRERDDAAERIAIEDSNRCSDVSDIGGLDRNPDISTTAGLALNESHAEPDRTRTRTQELHVRT